MSRSEKSEAKEDAESRKAESIDQGKSADKEIVARLNR